MKCTSCQRERTLYSYNLLCSDCLGADIQNPEYIRQFPVKAFVRTSWQLSQDYDDPTRTRLGIDLSVQTPVGFCQITIDVYQLYKNQYDLFDSRISEVDPAILLAYPQLAALKCKALDLVELFEYLIALNEEGTIDSVDLEYMPDPDLLSERFNQRLAIFRKGMFFKVLRLQKHKAMTYYQPLSVC